MGVSIASIANVPMAICSAPSEEGAKELVVAVFSSVHTLFVTSSLAGSYSRLPKGSLASLVTCQQVPPSSTLSLCHYAKTSQCAHEEKGNSKQEDFLRSVDQPGQI